MDTLPVGLQLEQALAGAVSTEQALAGAVRAGPNRGRQLEQVPAGTGSSEFPSAAGNQEPLRRVLLFHA